MSRSSPRLRETRGWEVSREAHWAVTAAEGSSNHPREAAEARLAQPRADGTLQRPVPRHAASSSSSGSSSGAFVHDPKSRMLQREENLLVREESTTTATPGGFPARGYLPSETPTPVRAAREQDPTAEARSQDPP